MLKRIIRDSICGRCHSTNVAVRTLEAAPVAADAASASTPENANTVTTAAVSPPSLPPLCTTCALVDVANNRWSKQFGIRVRMPFETLPVQFSDLFTTALAGQDSSSSCSFTDYAMPPPATPTTRRSHGSDDFVPEIFVADESAAEGKQRDQRMCSSQRFHEDPAVREITSRHFAFNRLTDSEIRQLPLVSYIGGKIVWLRRPADCEQLIRAAKADRVIAVDTESRPATLRRNSNVNNETGNLPCLIQIATRSAVFMMRLNQQNNKQQQSKHGSNTAAAVTADADTKKMHESLRKVLEDANVLKVGLAIHSDLKDLQRVISPFTPRSVVDLGSAARKARLPRPGLAPLVAAFTGRRVSKTFQMSDWATPVLGRGQIVYAATDAWVCLVLLPYFLRHGLLRPHGDDLLLGHPLIRQQQPAALQSLWGSSSSSSSISSSLAVNATNEQQQQGDNTTLLVERSGRQQQQQEQRKKWVLVRGLSVTDELAGAVTLQMLLRFCGAFGCVREISLLEKGEAEDGTTITSWRVTLLHCRTDYIAEVISKAFALFKERTELLKCDSVQTMFPQEALKFQAEHRLVDRVTAPFLFHRPKRSIVQPSEWLSLFGKPPQGQTVQHLIDVFASFGFPFIPANEATTNSEQSNVYAVRRVSVIDERFAVQMSSLDAALRAVMAMHMVAELEKPAELLDDLEVKPFLLRFTFLRPEDVPVEVEL